MKKLLLSLALLFMLQGCDVSEVREIPQDKSLLEPDHFYLPTNKKLLHICYGAVAHSQNHFSINFITRDMKPDEKPETYDVYDKYRLVAKIYEQKGNQNEGK